MSDRLFRQAISLSSGTVSYLIDCTLYDVVYTVRHEFALWCLKNPHYENWIKAWKVFSKNGAGQPAPTKQIGDEAMNTFVDLLQPYVDEAALHEQIEAQDKNEHIEAARRACPRCILNDKEHGADYCADCLRDIERGYEAVALAGRCANGFEGGKGTLYHAVKIGDNTAMCGAKPGRRSAGWSSYPVEMVTCPRCEKKLQHAR